MSLTSVSLMNPGILIRQNEDEMEDLEKSKQGDFRYKPKYCKSCKIMKQKSTFHCEDCDVCVNEFDHHCPWTGKCIGRGNIIFFYIFIFCSLVNMIYIILAVTTLTGRATRFK